MTYRPYMRGKQFELLTIRDTARQMSEVGFAPILEPVKRVGAGLSMLLSDADRQGLEMTVITNPEHGHYRADASELRRFLLDNADFTAPSLIKPGFILTPTTAPSSIQQFINEFASRFGKITLIHYGFENPKWLAGVCSLHQVEHVFMRPDDLLYRRHFRVTKGRTLVVDGFEKKKNADYARLDHFSDLHEVYGEYGLDGFGDFLTVGREYSEGGGPAYAVAIHLTFIDPDKDHSMFVAHFKSSTNDTIADTAGKFGEALRAFMRSLDKNEFPFVGTSAISALRELHERRHFPGLGVLKKLSMTHHIETLAEHFRG